MRPGQVVGGQRTAFLPELLCLTSWRALPSSVALFPFHSSNILILRAEYCVRHRTFKVTWAFPLPFPLQSPVKERAIREALQYDLSWDHGRKNSTVGVS